MDFADSVVSNNPKLNQRLDKIDRLVKYFLIIFDLLLYFVYNVSDMDELK